MQKNVMSGEPKVLGLTEMLAALKSFKPCACYIPQLRLVVIATKDKSSTAHRVNGWLDIHWQNHRPWYAPWRKCIGFAVYCPKQFGFSGSVRVTEILNRMLLESRFALGTGEYTNLLYRRAGSLTVDITE